MKIATVGHVLADQVGLASPVDSSIRDFLVVAGRSNIDPHAILDRVLERHFPSFRDGSPEYKFKVLNSISYRLADAISAPHDRLPDPILATIENIVTGIPGLSPGMVGIFPVTGDLDPPSRSIKYLNSREYLNSSLAAMR